MFAVSIHFLIDSGFARSFWWALLGMFQKQQHSVVSGVGYPHWWQRTLQSSWNSSGFGMGKQILGVWKGRVFFSKGASHVSGSRRPLVYVWQVSEQFDAAQQERVIVLILMMGRPLETEDQPQATHFSESQWVPVPVPWFRVPHGSMEELQVVASKLWDLAQLLKSRTDQAHAAWNSTSMERVANCSSKWWAEAG